MAIRFTAANTQCITRTANLISGQGVHTWMGWFYVLNTTADQALFYVGDGTDAQNFDYLAWSNHTTYSLLGMISTWGFGEEFNVEGATHLEANTWYHFTMVRTAVDAMIGYLNGASEVTGTNFSVASRAAATINEIGRRDSANHYMDGRVAYVKAWSAALTASEVLQEMNVIRPVRTADLYGWWPTFADSAERTRDYSGNGYDFTAVGTLTDEDAPPVGYGNHVFVLPTIDAVTGGITYTETGGDTSTRQVSGASVVISKNTGLAVDSKKAGAASVLRNIDTASAQHADQASASARLIVPNSGQAQQSKQSSARDSLVLPSAGSDTSTHQSSAVDAGRYVDTGSATDTHQASGADVFTAHGGVYTDTGAINSPHASSGLDQYITSDSATAAHSCDVSGADRLINVDTGGATSTRAGAAADQLFSRTVYVDTGAAVSTHQISGADVYTPVVPSYSSGTGAGGWIAYKRGEINDDEMVLSNDDDEAVILAAYLLI